MVGQNNIGQKWREMVSDENFVVVFYENVSKCAVRSLLGLYCDKPCMQQ